AADRAARAENGSLRLRGRVQRPPDHVLLLGRAARGLPRTGEGPRRALPHADRAAPDRRAGPGAAPGRLRPVRPRVLLLDLAQGLPSGDAEDGARAAALA